MKKKIKVFVSGCYDILHAGHVQFFKDAKALGNHLTVCFASDKVLELYKRRISSMPEDNKAVLIGAIRYVDKVVKSSDEKLIFDFTSHILKDKSDILAVTEDDKHKEEKKEFCKEHGIKFVILPKRNAVTQISTTAIRERVKKG
jgi:cytidyltransferase-like protein